MMNLSIEQKLKRIEEIASWNGIATIQKFPKTDEACAMWLVTVAPHKPVEEDGWSAFDLTPEREFEIDITPEYPEYMNRCLDECTNYLQQVDDMIDRSVMEGNYYGDY